MGMEVFSILIEKATVEGFMTGYRFIGRNGETLHIPHLLFADDTLVFYNDSVEQLSSIYWILLWFEAYSSLRINLEKSVIMPMGKWIIQSSWHLSLVAT